MVAANLINSRFFSSNRDSGKFTWRNCSRPLKVNRSWWCRAASLLAFSNSAPACSVRFMLLSCAPGGVQGSGLDCSDSVLLLQTSSTCFEGPLACSEFLGLPWSAEEETNILESPTPPRASYSASACRVQLAARGLTATCGSVAYPPLTQEAVLG